MRTIPLGYPGITKLQFVQTNNILFLYVVVYKGNLTGKRKLHANITQVRDRSNLAYPKNEIANRMAATRSARSQCMYICVYTL